ncbi:MAG: antibiotic biosynthesis monooxygenase [Sphingobacteriales bacterium]|nr:MAG: antibiotic biosynthesis monooxygenase [Sphingobacteriales bacterium]
MIRIVKMHFRDEEVENFLQLFNEVYPMISSFAGCSELRLLRDKHTENILFTYSIWDHEKSLEAYRNSELFARTWKRTKALFAFKAEAWSVEEVTPGFLPPYTA